MRFFHGKINQRAKTEVFINPDFFEYHIDRKATAKLGIPVNCDTATMAVASKKGFILRDSGEIVVKQRVETPEVSYHREQKDRIEKMKQAVINEFNAADKSSIGGDWLKSTIDRFINPNRGIASAKKDFHKLFEEYTEGKAAATTKRNLLSLLKIVARYEMFVRATENKNFTFDVDRITKDTIEDFISYLRNEKQLTEEHPELFSRIYRDCKQKFDKRTAMRKRGDNSIIVFIRDLLSFFNWLNRQGITTNKPFEGVEVGAPQYGTPYYISIAERNQIADFDFSNNTKLEVTRDIFIFQCFIGCRASDLIKLTENNIVNGILIYTPQKTKNETGKQARIPLHPKASALIEKYRGIDPKGRLFPFISVSEYNKRIKEIFTAVGITRNVEVRNSLTGDNEMRPLNEIASSHLARRTFIGNAYFKVSDPNIIGAMSGHTEGSTAFARYRNIEVSTLQAVIDQLG